MTLVLGTLTLTATSCSKTYYCECNYTETSGGEVTAVESLKAINKERGEVKCDNSKSQISNYENLTINCDLR